MDEKSGRHLSLLISICLAAAVIAVYWPVYNYDFVGYDDDIYVTKNANIQSGLNWQSIRWAFTTGYAANWHPVTWLSLMLDYQIFEDRAGGYHLVNVLFHIANTLILFYVLMRMTGTVWPSAFVAAIFALHPLHVESVAWIAERKDVLSAFFWFLTMWAYVRYVQNPRIKEYLAALILFVLGLMSKPMLVTLPFVLLLLDYWPLQRKICRRQLIEKIPFFILSLVCCAVTFLAQRSSGAVSNIEAVGFKMRVGNAIVSYAAYIMKMIWPSRLAVLYPYPGNELSMTKTAVCGLLLLSLTIYFIYTARRHRFFAVGWLWFIGTLVPVIGLVQVGVQATADRYTYITLTGLFIIIAWSAKEFVPKQRYKISALAAAVILIACGAAAFGQLGYWKNSLTLFEHTLGVTKNNYIILYNYANALRKQNRIDEAISFYNESLAVKPNFAEAHTGLGYAMLKTGEPLAAIGQFRLAIKYEPNFAPAYNNLAVVLYSQGRAEEAISCFERALKIKPDYAEAHGGLGSVLLDAGNIPAAIEHLKSAIRYKPGLIQAYIDLAVALDTQGKNKEAVGYLERALKIDPNDPTLRQLLEEALKKQRVVK